MIRVLHSVSNMDRAGIETMLMNYYRHMDRSKIQFDFLCNKQKSGDYDEEIRSLGGKLYRTPGLNPIKYPAYLTYMRSVFAENTDCRIVEAHNGALGVYALFAAKKNRIPVRIFHAHSASIARDWKLPLKLLCRAFLPMSMNGHFTCGHAAAACYFPKKIVQQQKYVLIPNAIEINRFRFDGQARQKLREEYGLADKHVVGHVGRFCPPKNQSFLLEAFAEVRKQDPKAFLVFAGEGDQMDMVQKKAKAMHLDDSVLFLGNIPNVNQWYQAFDAFVLPSAWEGLPVVGVEAQAADLPCVFSGAITREVDILEKTRFVDLAEGPEKWAEAICQALTEQTRTDVSATIAEYGYDICEQAQKLQAYYLQMAGVQE